MDAGSRAARLHHRHTHAHTQARCLADRVRLALVKRVDDGSRSLLELFVCKVPEDPLLCVTGLILLIVLHRLLFIHLTHY